jgi:signal transduction histidine kinase
MTETVLSKNPRREHIWEFLAARVAPLLGVIFQLLAIVALATVAINAVGYSKAPFIGSFVEHTLLINNVDSVRPGTWNAKNAGLDFGNQILAIDGQLISSVKQFNDVIRKYEVGQVIALTVLTPEYQELTVDIELQTFPVPDLVAHLIIPFIIGLIYLGCGLWVLSLRRYDTTGQVFSTFTASVAVAVAGIFDTNTSAQLTGLWTFCLAMAGGTILHFALIFPQELKPLQRRPFLGWLSYIPSVILIWFAFPTLFDFQQPQAYVNAWLYEYIFLGIAALLFLSIQVVRRFTTASPIIRQQSQIVIWGEIIAFFPMVAWFFYNTLRPAPGFSPYLSFPLVIFPIVIAYTILRYRLINTDYIFSRAVLYALLTIMAASGYALLVAGFSLILGDQISATNPIVIGIMVFGLALLLDPVRTQLQTLVDLVFFRGQQAYRERVQAFSQDLNPAMELRAIVNLLREYVEKSLEPSQIHVFIYDPSRDYYISFPDGSGRSTTDVQFAVSGALPRMLALRKTFIFLGEDVELPKALEPEKQRLFLLGAQLFVPLPGRDDQVLGFMALTPRRSGEPYKSLDMTLLTSLADQSALAVERAQVVSDLERRVNEMNVLIRVAQGINITLDYDDILELIYAQTNRLIPTRDFWIVLYDQENDLYHYAFYLEDDKRLLHNENRYLVGEHDLTQTVIRAGRSIVTSDYDRECQKLGIGSRVQGLYAWVGVPLNAGATTIGAMSLGSRDSSIFYTDEQVELLQAIADQAAGAIVKTRLLEDSERSARQLTLLNEVGRNLTSTLDLSNLLNQIMENAVEILNSEAGTLFLVDEETGELIFEVVTGPVAEELIGRRLAPGTGHVGRAVETGNPAIVNEVRRTAEWSEQPDQQTGFKTRDLLLVPMFIKDRVVGVLEVINRKDGMPFTSDDQDLLTTFTSQAAIALENARLYTLTDQQLAARVDELSVMQRIDRELNASLDVDRAMRITLDWAMRQSHADAGLVGAVEVDGIRVMADQGYSVELDPYRESLLPLELPALKRAVEEEQTQQFHRSILERGGSPQEQSSNSYGLLEGALGQLVIPIRRGEQVIGVVMLESRSEEPWSEDTQAFLSRLSDHAAIAIANAQLFNQVQAADLAKSEFVSFVSHELKTPMTSIRGYTDLLLGGAVGPINEAQDNFLSTVRANVNRMATLVSDLTDVSRIETGRLRLEFQAVTAEDIVDEVVRSQRRDMDEKEQTLEVQIPAELPPIWGDRTRLVQVLTNLVSNAHKYTPQGGSITIIAEQSANHWDPDGAPQVVRISVSDTGIGMSPEDQEMVFTKFFRSEDPQARESPGTGLGLNITRYLVEMQGGKIWFESEYRLGTTFNFTVPVAEM